MCACPSLPHPLCAYNIVSLLATNYLSGKPIFDVNCMYVEHGFLHFKCQNYYWLEWTMLNIDRFGDKTLSRKIWTLSIDFLFLFTDDFSSSSCQMTMSKKFSFKYICTYIDNNACMKKKRDDKTCWATFRIDFCNSFSNCSWFCRIGPISAI